MFEKINALYNSIETFEVNKLKIPFNSSWKKIGVNLSGGADSACLTMLLCDYIVKNNLNTKIYVITFIRCWNTRPWQKPVAEKVYRYLKELYPLIIQDQFFCFIAPEIEHSSIGNIVDNRSADQITVSSFNEYTAFVHNFDAIFNATTRNPSGTEFEDRMKNRDIEIDSAELQHLYYVKKEVAYSMPFKYVEKDWIIAQYKIFNQWNLFEITRSCEGDFLTSAEIRKTNKDLRDFLTNAEIRKTIKDLTDYRPGAPVYECGLCFWCREREWALDRLNITIEKITEK